ncbi:radical SAM protein [Heliobacterium gestii]|uniref:Radical SAM protein n=1 Tax=Heliomicrobium gestii TaxID=2699 RepID=A0A845LHV1_HELGE|nr:radical SAM protein [Heliomicrobium gestii]MBM7866687.1 MoaA/NifB/PqqE/SkfB family radical SAM enzyme [Heliomicrobium gestii]MZP43033.1 radical SAM protein [Heliomicrobium gestii]
MVDQLRIDTHKLIYHPTRVSEWLQGKNIYPIYVEIAPSGACNHRCIFCALDYMEYRPVFLDKELILSNLKEMGEKGVKSVMYAGEGEPLLNRHTPEIVWRTKELGIDVSMTSNGVLFSREAAEECLGCFSWVRFSVNAGSPASYQTIHRTRSNDFERVLENLQNAVALKRDKGYRTTIGVQMLLIPENTGDALPLAKTLKEIGVDYFSIKPYSQHPKSHAALSTAFDYEQHLGLERQLTELKSDDFQIIFRAKAMQKLKHDKAYECCWGLPFWAYIDAKANVWGCSAYLGDEDFCYGSLKSESFAAIWEGERRAESLKKVAQMDIRQCREICRLDEINGYLQQLKKPGDHVNFI